MKQLTYLACPYSHERWIVRVYRFRAANRCAAALLKKGKLVFSPISHTHPIAEEGELPKGWEFWHQFDRAYLEASKELLVLTIDGWRESTGVQAEIEIARELGLPVGFVNVAGEEVLP